MDQKEKEKYERFEQLLKYWESVPDDSGEKLYWIANSNGDVEAAKWAFLKANGPSLSGRTPALRTLPPTSSSGYEVKANLLLRIWLGDVNFWKLWLLGSVLPNFVLRPLFYFLFLGVDPMNFYPQSGSIALFITTLVLTWSVFTLVGLSRAALAMEKRGSKPWEYVPAFFIVLGGWIFTGVTLIVVINQLMGKL